MTMTMNVVCWNMFGGEEEMNYVKIITNMLQEEFIFIK